MGTWSSRTRTLIVGASAIALVAVAAIAAVARTGGGSTPINCMDAVWRTSEATTTSTTFTNVHGLADSPSAVFPISIDVSAVVSGAPVEFRIVSTNVGGQTRVSKPGAATFVPSGGVADSFAYRWIERNQSAAVHANELRLQWRSVNGGAVHLLRGDLSVQYATERGACAPA
jgi:hypothetical protein